MSSSPAITGRHAAGLSPLAEVWSIAWPTVVTMTSYTVMQFIDKLMIGQVGPTALAAQTNGAIWSFAPLAFAMGLLTVVNTYVAQNLGAGTPRNGPKYAWASMWFSLAMWLCVMLPWALVLPLLFANMEGHTPELQRLESGYAQILLSGSFVLLASRGLNHYFFGLHRPRVVTIAAITGNVVNVLGNYVLIFGERGLPEFGLPGVPGVPAMGVYGAAISTVVGTAVELAIPLAIFLGPKMHAELGSRASWRPAWGPVRDLARIGWPAALQFGNEIVCWSIFMTIIIGWFGVDHMAACSVIWGYMHLSFMPAVGFSVAVNSLVGKYIGARQPNTGVARARLGLALSVAYMTTCALIFLIFREPLVELFLAGADINPERMAHIVEIGSALMICAAVFQTVDAFGIVYTGALRGAGDTIWPGVLTVIYSWLFIVAGAAGMAQVWPELGSIGPWISAAVYIIVYGVTMAWRFESGAWRSIRLLELDQREAAHVAPIGPVIPATDPSGATRDMAEEIADAAAEESGSPLGVR